MAITDKQVEEMTEKLRVHFGSASKGELIAMMADRFLSWKLPEHFAPDGGITFKPTKPYNYNELGWWPVGTNLLTAEQAKDMIRYMLTPKQP